ncbi:MAG TPA: DegT/DnrJ/EryC1/StrS family aminotransferase [Thermomicrobiales bacterium]|nr:DegT/DnrJ/EryC1/StrS family aminotransferase [Thermomicrobiales bacterium]
MGDRNGDRLAVDGGTPVRRSPLPGVERRAMGDEEIAALTQVIHSGQLGRHGGTKVKELERVYADFYGVKHAIAVSSGSAAVHTAVATNNPEPGDEIITTPCSDFGTVLGILFQNAIPVFADLDPETFCLDPASVEARITDRTRAIVAVHLFGGLADVDALRAISERHGIPLIEDCAQAQLSEYRGKLAGTMGALGCFSLNNTKHLNAGEGGLVVTNDDALARRARLFADKAWPRDQEGRFSLFLGQNYRLGELQAAVALVGLRRLRENVEARRRAVDRIYERIIGVPGIRIPAELPDTHSSYWILHLFVDDRIDANEVASALAAEGIPFGAKYVTPLYTWPVLRDRQTYGKSGFPFNSPYTNRPFDYAPGLCPVFEAAREHLILLSIDEQWSDADADDVATAIRKVFAQVAPRTEAVHAD